jgi:hypothetical protein
MYWNIKTLDIWQNYCCIPNITNKQQVTEQHSNCHRCSVTSDLFLVFRMHE